MRKLHLLLLLLFCGVNLYAQNEVPRKGFSSPFNFPSVLSGNFGELRENHFHGGLDFKTHYQTGKKLLALADGYINRVQVSHDSGYVVHVTYNNGFTTINRHLEGVVGRLANFVDSVQYTDKKWVMNAYFKPNEYPVIAGEHIGWSGNMGYSFAPHLHLDVYETKSGDYIDPLPFFADQIKDTTPPRARGFMLYPQRNIGVVNDSSKFQEISLTHSDSIFAWGSIGVAIKAYDHMDGVTNKYGVKSMLVFADDQLIFESFVDRYAYNEHRYINSWSYNDYMKAFIEPGNKLRMLKAHNKTRGIVEVKENRPYVFKFVLSDYYKNTSTYTLTVYGREQVIPKKESTKTLVWNEYNHFSSMGLDLAIPRNQLYATTDLNFKVFPRSDYPNAQTMVYQLIDLDDYVPFHRWARLKIRVPEDCTENRNKLYITRITNKGKFVNVGGAYKDGFIETTVSKLGTFTIAVDTIPPVVEAKNKNNWIKQRQVTFKAKDHQTGIGSYYGTIDGEYALFYQDIMPDEISYRIDGNHLKKNQNHQIVLMVTDRRGNTTKVKETFYW